MCGMNSSSGEQMWVADFWLSDIFCMPVHVADTEGPTGCRGSVLIGSMQQVVVQYYQISRFHKNWDNILCWYMLDSLQLSQES